MLWFCKPGSSPVRSGCYVMTRGSNSFRIKSILTVVQKSSLYLFHRCHTISHCFHYPYKLWISVTSTSIFIIIFSYIFGAGSFAVVASIVTSQLDHCREFLGECVDVSQIEAEHSFQRHAANIQLLLPFVQVSPKRFVARRVSKIANWLFFSIKVLSIVCSAVR